MKKLFSFITLITCLCLVSSAWGVWAPNKPNKLRPMSENMDYLKANNAFLQSLAGKLIISKKGTTWVAGWDNASVDNATLFGPMPTFTGASTISGPTLKAGQMSFSKTDNSTFLYTGSAWKNQAGNLPLFGVSTRPTCNAANMGDMYADNVTGKTMYCDNTSTWVLAANAATSGVTALTGDTGGVSVTGTSHIAGGTGIATESRAGLITLNNTGVTSVGVTGTTGVQPTGAVKITAGTGITASKDDNTITISRADLTGQTVTKREFVAPITISTPTADYPGMTFNAYYKNYVLLHSTCNQYAIMEPVYIESTVNNTITVTLVYYNTSEAYVSELNIGLASPTSGGTGASWSGDQSCGAKGVNVIDYDIGASFATYSTYAGKLAQVVVKRTGASGVSTNAILGAVVSQSYTQTIP